MKRYALPVLIWLWGAGLASAWWAAAVFGGWRGCVLMLVPSSVTLGAALGMAAIHWEDK